MKKKQKKKVKKRASQDRSQHNLLVDKIQDNTLIRLNDSNDQTIIYPEGLVTFPQEPDENFEQVLQEIENFDKDVPQIQKNPSDENSINILLVNNENIEPEDGIETQRLERENQRLQFEKKKSEEEMGYIRNLLDLKLAVSMRNRKPEHNLFIKTIKRCFKPKKRNPDDLKKYLKSDAESEFEKMIRVRRLWHKVRQVYKVGTFIKRIDEQTKQSGRQIQRGMTMTARYEIAINNDKEHWRCLILKGSQFYKFWNIMMIIGSFKFGYEMMQSVSNQYLSTIFMIIESNGEIPFSINIIIGLFFADIIYNMIVEHDISETERTKYIKDSVKYYLKKEFWLDLIAIQFLAFMPFMKKEKTLKTMKDFALIKLVEYQQSYELTPELQSEISEILSVHQDSISEVSYKIFKYIQFSFPLFFLKFFNLERFMVVFNAKEQILTLFADNQNMKNVQSFLQFLIIFIEMTVTIYTIGTIQHLFSMHHQMFCLELLIRLAKDNFQNNINNLHRELLEHMYFQIYQMTTMVTTVGYGDEISTMSLEYEKDYTNHVFFIMIGVLIFRFSQATLTQFLNRFTQNQFSIQEQQSLTNDDIESYFNMHNSITGPKFLEYKSLENWKYQCDQNFKFNYKSTTQSLYFTEMTPKLKQKILKEIMRNEITFFKHLFFNDDKLIVNSKIITNLLANIQSQVPDKNQFLISNGEQFKNFFLIKYGVVKVFDQNYTYMYDLENGSFFGEYNILFGLRSNMYYRVSSTSHHLVIFTIDYEVFVNSICQDINCFKHIYNIAIQRFRYNTNILNYFKVQNYLEGQQNNKKESRWPLQEAILLMGNKFKKANQDMFDFYETIQQKWKTRIANKLNPKQILSQHSDFQCSDADESEIEDEQDIDQVEQLKKGNYDHDLNSDDEVEQDLIITGKHHLEKLQQIREIEIQIKILNEKMSHLTKKGGKKLQMQNQMVEGAILGLKAKQVKRIRNKLNI